MDVAPVGKDGSPTVVLSSGVHGIEGFVGSAVQLAFLKQLSKTGLEPKTRYVLIHAVNPFGFAFLRRANEVDLNRNFLTEDRDYKGASDGERRSFLHPESPPSRFEPFKL